ncbi:MAG: hypothetical protein ABI877_23135, partial [Gemmatimonadaceae bacterium]
MIRSSLRPRRLPSRRGRLGLVLFIVTSAGCRQDAVTEPATFVPTENSAISPQTFTPPPWFLGSLPPEAVPIWNQCIADGTAAYAGTSYTQGVNCRLIDVDGYPRRFIVYVSTHLSLAPGSQIPIVFMFHGSSGSGEQFLKISGWKEQAEQEGFISVFPTGLKYSVLPAMRKSTKWNSFGLVDQIDTTWRVPHYPPSSPMPADDMKFTNLMLDDLIALLPLDSHRYFSSGFSNGGEFVSRLAVEASDRLAAVGVFAGGLTEEYQPLMRIPVKLGVGTFDDRVISSVNASLLPGQDSIAELPLDADSIIQYVPTRRTGTSFALTFDLNPGVYQTTGDSISTSMFWNTPQAGNSDGNVFEAAILKGVSHQYPR